MYCGAVYCIPQQSSGTSVHVVKLLLLLSDGTMRPSAFLFVVLVHSATADVTTLKPFQHVNRELLELDTGVKPYRLAGLKPSTGYEVRLSWPASIPATVQFELVDGASSRDSPLQLARHRSARRLLDCEKLVFHTDSQSSVQGFKDPQVLISAFRRSVHRDGPKAGVSKIVYNIVLAELAFGLPRDIVPVVAAVLGSVVIAVIWSLYWSKHIYPWLLVWLTTTDRTATAADSSSKRDS